MRRAALVTFLLILPTAAALGLDTAPAPHAAAPAPGQDLGAPDAPRAAGAGPYSIGFQCAGTAQDTAVATATCPAYVLDREDIMAQPILLVDPAVPTLVGFNALHGGRGLHPVPGDDSPTERSRDNAVHQTHTTFTTANAGASWEDQPYHAPDSLAKEDRQIYGEDNAAALDGAGRLYLASLYSYRDGAATAFAPASEFHYAVGVWKQHRLDRAVDYAVNTKILFANGSVEGIFLIHAPATDEMVLLWRETVHEASFVQAYHTKPGEGAIWTKLDAPLAEGCTSLTNPIAVGADVYFGCRGESTWTIHALDTRSWTARKAGEATATEAHGLLVKRGDAGLMVLVTSGLAPDGRAPAVRLSYGELGARWDLGEDVAPKLTRANGAPLGDARVTAAAFAPHSGNLHIIYMERVDAARTGSPNTDRPEFTKVLASIQAEGSFQGVVDLQVGRISRVDFSPTLTGVGNGAYADLHDSLVLASDGRELVAYGDYGFVRYAEVVEKDFLPPIAPLGAQAPAIPLASGGISPALYGIPAGLLSGAMIARTLMAKRKQAVEAPSE